MSGELCPVCGAAAAPGETGLLECPRCGLAYSGVRSFSAPVYKPGLEHGIYSAAKATLFQTALDVLGAALPGRGLLLDIGCADGEMMKAAAARGWEAEGVEIDPRLAAAASAAGLKIHALPVESAGLAACHYDAVTAFEVFSQMDAPVAAAAEVFKLLKPGGMLYIREFNAAFHLPLHELELRGVFKPLGLRPSIVHNLNFTALSLRRLLERAGFRDIEISNSPPTSGDPYRTGGRLGGFLTSLLKVLYYLLARAVSFVAFGKILAGSTLIVTARK